MKQSKNSLTIHLYSRDEVLASIRYAILCRNHMEAIFWGLELYDSNMEQDALEMLAMTWSTGIGVGSWEMLETLVRFQDEASIDRDEWCRYIMACCRIKIHDTTIFHLLLRGSEAGGSRISFPHEKEYKTPLEAIEDTVRRGKLLEAWRLISFRDIGVWSLLEGLAPDRIKTLKKVNGLSIYEQVAAALVIVVHALHSPSAGSSLPLEYEMPVEVSEAIEAWDAEDCLRKRRVFKIRYEALAYLCTRSTSTESNEHLIMDGLEASLRESSYWKANWRSDSKKEAFYDTFFPFRLHDIPDEWSAADREKSHGRGLGKTAEQGVKQFIEHTLRRSTSFIWGFLDRSPTLVVPSLDWAAIYTTRRQNMAPMAPMAPIKKAFEIQE